MLSDPAEAEKQLQRVVDGRPPTSAAKGPDGGVSGPPRVALLFTGQGAQYAGMAAGLRAASPRFAAHLDATCAACDAHLPAPLLPVILGLPEAEGDVNHTAWTQPALFAVEVALARLLADWGLRGEVMVGHSIGELAAACVAGMMELHDAARLVVARGQLMGALPPGGAMSALKTDEPTVRAALAGVQDVDIAAINAPEQVVISGSEAGVAAVEARLADQGLRGSRLMVSHAFHSPLMDPMLDAFAAVAAGVALRPGDRALISNLDGAWVGPGSAPPGGPTHAAYWVRHVRGAVRFADGVRALVQAGVQLAVEVGPQPILSGLAHSSGLHAEIMPALRRKRSDPDLIGRVLAGAWVLGVPVDWAAFSRR